MPTLNPAASERQFKTFARKAHRGLAERGHAIPLAQLQEILVQALGHAHLHAAKQAWAPAPVGVNTVWLPPCPEETSRETLDQIDQMPLVVTLGPPQEERPGMLLERLTRLVQGWGTITVEGPPEMSLAVKQEASGVVPLKQALRQAMATYPSVGGSLWTPCERYWGHDLECHEGVIMDADIYAEGWSDDQIFPPCPCNPKHCATCKGSGTIEVADALGAGAADCPDCHNGWRGSPEWPHRVTDTPD